MDSKDLYFIIFLYKKNGCRRSFCVDVYTTKGIRFHEPNRIRFVRINEVLLEQNLRKSMRKIWDKMDTENMRMDYLYNGGI